MKSHLRRLRNYFGDGRAFDVGSRDIESFVSELRTEKKANATINRSLQLLHQAYDYAVTSDPPKLSRAPKIELLSESDNRRTGEFTAAEAEQLARSLPSYMADVARFAYETGARAGEILQLCWPHLDGSGINVSGAITKNGQDRTIALTEELEEILERRRQDIRPGCELIFHHDGQSITDYRKCWHSACVTNGLGAYFCRDCRDESGEYLSQLDAEKTCPRCGKKYGKTAEPKYVGRLFHDFRRSAAHEMWKAGSSVEDCMKVTGHKTASMFKRYADLFSTDEERARQLEVQNRRREWKKAQAANVVTMPKRTAVQ